jgi:hypothetical protein
MKGIIGKLAIVIADIPFVKRDAEWKSVRAKDEESHQAALAHGLYLQGCRALNRFDVSGNTQEMMLGNCYLAAADVHTTKVFTFRELAEDLNDPATRLGALRRFHQARL